MKVRVQMMIQDPRFAPKGTERIIEGFEIEKEPFFLDGPVTARVAVLDFNAATGKLESGARFIAPTKGIVMGKYDVDNQDIESHHFNQVSAFATVLRTIYMAEEDDALGRPIRWAFDAPQLFVIPRAGLMENAYYERDSHSLQFFYFPNPQKDSEMIYTSLSRDIVAHETGHAILDSIAPHLYNAISPQSLAIHEGIADLTALIMAFRSRNLVETVLKVTKGSIHESTQFSSIAEQFGMSMGKGALRNLFNDKTMDDVDPVEPHSLSEVLTGAIYSMVMNIFEAKKAEEIKRTGKSEISVSGKALVETGQQIKRMLFRAMEYLPPGEVSFADFVRAMIAADQVAHPKDPEERDWIRKEFVRRKIVDDDKALQVETPDLTLTDVNSDFLMDSDWAAYEFANQHRELLGIPPDISFQVGPRIKADKVYPHRDKDGQPFKEVVRELILKVWWNQNETSGLDRRFPTTRQITVGSTLAMEWDTHKVRMLLSCGKKARPDEDAVQLQNRIAMVRRLADQGLIVPGRTLKGPEDKTLRSAMNFVSSGDVMRIRGASRLLHII